MEFWKEHVKTRVVLITLFFIVGLILVFAGWKMTGKLAGLGLMIIGVILLPVSYTHLGKATIWTEHVLSLNWWLIWRVSGSRCAAL